MKNTIDTKQAEIDVYYTQLDEQMQIDAKYSDTRVYKQIENIKHQLIENVGMTFEDAQKIIMMIKEMRKAY
jgi:hypothetical protein